MIARVLKIGAYLLSAIALVAATFLLVAYGQGYSFDLKNQRVVFKGLLITASTPSGATVSIGGKSTRHKTPYRTTLEGGDYTVTISKVGFRSWTKLLTIIPSGVTQAQYVLLWPLEIKIQPSIATSTVSSLFSTPDRHHVGYLTAGAEPGIWTLSSDGRSSSKVYTPKVAASDQPAEQLSSIVYSDDGSHILAKSVIGAKTSYLLIAASPGGTVTNLTDLFGFSFNDLRFNPSNWRELYWTAPEGLRRLNVEAQTVSVVLADKVSAYALDGDRVFYVQTTDLGKSVWSLDRSGHKQEVIQSLPESPAYRMVYNNYQGHEMLAVAASSTTTATLYNDIFTANPVSTVISKSVSDISFNPTGRYLVFRSPSGFGSYDLERAQLSPLQSFAQPPTYFDWVDDYHLAEIINGHLSLVEYDGGNPVELDTSVSAGSSSFFSPDGKHVLWINHADASDQIFETDIKR